MRIVRGDVRRVGGRVRAVHTALGRFAERHGVVLRLSDAAGRVGEGEASPLPGYSPDDLDDVDRALRAIDWQSIALDADADLPAIASLCQRLLPPGLPSARFAMETALGDLLAKIQGKPLWQWIGTAEPGAVPLSSVVTTLSAQDAVEEARTAVRAGIRTLKVKIGRAGRLAEETALVRALGEAFAKDGVTLRLDANGCLAVEDAAERLASLRDCPIEWIEEPVPFHDWTNLRDGPPPIALDESLTRPDVWDGLDVSAMRSRCVAVVLKPASLGGLSLSLARAAEARERGLDVVVSHLFDGPIGLAAAAHLALVVASRGRASGLSEHVALGAHARRGIPYLGACRLTPGTAPGLGLEGDPS